MLLKVNGVARLTRDVELRYLPSGSAVAKLGFAMSKKYKTQSGEQKEDTCFIDGAVFGKLGEVANQYLKKGSKIYIDGELKLEQWTAQDGTNKSKHTIQINTFEMLDSKQDNQQSNSYQQPQQNQGQQQGYNQNPPVEYQRNDNQPKIPEIDIDEDSIPF